MKKLVLLAIVPLVLVGCKKTASTQPPSETATANASGSAMMGTTVTVPLNEENKSGQSGTATLEEKDGKVMVTLNLTGGSATAQPAHIHAGSCPTVGDIKYKLSNVVNGKSETTIDATMADLKAAGALAINVHKSAAQVSVYTSCGDLNTSGTMMKPEEKLVNPTTKPGY